MRFDFICGCGHSGTTLLLKIISQVDEIYTPNAETNMMGAPQGVEHFIDKLEKKAKDNTCKRIVEKTPRHIRCMDEIRHIFPGAKFVIPVRDGRDVVASMKKRFGGCEKDVRRWIKDNDIVKYNYEKNDVYVYRHEDFVKNPELYLKEIADFLGFKFSQNLLDYYNVKDKWSGVKGDEKGSGKSGVEHNKLRSWQIQQPIFDNSGRWREELNEEEVAFVNKNLLAGRGGELMKFFGYI